MYTIRATQKLLRRLGAQDDEDRRPPTTALGDWYCNLLWIGRRQLILCVSERGLLPVVLPARDVKSELARALPEALAAVLAAIGVAEADAKRELAEMGEHAVGKTASRTVLGSMNDFAVAINYAIRGSRPVRSLLELALFLAETPCSPLGYERPMGVARRLLGASSSTVDS